MAEECTRITEQNLDETEELDVMLVPMDKAIDMVMNNEICCNSSVHGILKAARIKGF